MQLLFNLLVQVFLWYSLWQHNLIMVGIGFALIAIEIAYAVGKDNKKK